MSNHFTGLSLGPPLGDQRLDLCDLYAFQSPADPDRTVLILNAFELVTLTARQKHDLSIELLRLQDELHVTVIVFTTEVRKEMKPGLWSRGPIGRLQCLAGTVIKIEGDGETS